jgi:phage-related protein (TIGR01555 family)
MAAAKATARQKTARAKRVRQDMARADSWQNMSTGMGDPSRDKIVQGGFMPIQEISYGEIESLYYGDDMVEKVVDSLPDEAFRRGFALEGPLAETCVTTLAGLDATDKCRDAYAWARLWGGTGMVLGADDGLEVTKPLNVESVKAVRFLNVVDRRYIQPQSYYANPLAPNFGMPETYNVTPVFGEMAQGTIVHESRIIKFYGTKIDTVTTRRLAGWSYSVLQRPYEILRMFATAFGSAAQIMSDSGQAILDVNNLMTQLSGPNRLAILDRFTALDMQRSSGRMILLDKDNESFHREPVQVAGLSDLLDHFEMRLAAAAKMPVTRLMGRSPAGENATGESDEKMWNTSVKAEQQKNIEPKLVRLLNVITAGKWSADRANKITWASMEEPDDLQDAQVNKLKAETWQIYNTIGALSGEQVALVEFLEKPVAEVLDEDALTSIVESDTELALNPPPMPAMPPAALGAMNGPPGGPPQATRALPPAPSPPGR